MGAPSEDSSLDSEEQYHLLSEKRLQHRDKRSRNYSGVAKLVLAVLLLVVPPATYWLGLQRGRAVLPHMPTDVITRNAVKYELKYLDDEFHVELEENKKFKGLPRPELDEVWEDITRGIHIRVPHDAAVESNFTSIELSDGSGDSWGTPAVFHNLHCLRYIRQAQFPEKYPHAYELMKPQPNGAMAEHFDHCLDNLRQAIMCQGDMALYHYGWQPDTTHPWLSMKRPHVCVNWEHLQGWASDHSFSIWDGVLKHPILGIADPSTWQ